MILFMYMYITVGVMDIFSQKMTWDDNYWIESEYIYKNMAQKCSLREDWT